jgi:hypothetical protein
MPMSEARLRFQRARQRVEANRARLEFAELTAPGRTVREPRAFRYWRLLFA